MAWETLTRPEISKKGRSMVSVSVRQTKTGKIGVMFNLANSLNVKYEGFAGLNVAVGKDEHLGQLQFQFVKDGYTFKLGKGPAQTGAVTLISFPGVPDFKVGSLPCKLLEEKDDSITIELPLAEWQSMRAAKGRPAPVAVTHPTTVRGSATPSIQAAPTANTAPKVDPIAYLNKKGHKVAKLAPPHWQLDGERVTTDAIVMLINKYRSKEGIRTISAFDLSDPLGA